MFLNAAYAKGKESDERSLDAAAYLDISFLPIGPRRRRAYMGEDWQRGRYLWARVGYDHVFKATEGESSPSVAEDRGIVSLWGKVPVALPPSGWRAARAPTCAGSVPTTRPATAGGSRPRASSSCFDHSVVPYLNVEWFYDTRYDGWARTLYQAGSEVTVSRHFRFELNLSQTDGHAPGDLAPERDRHRGQGLLLRSSSASGSCPTGGRATSSGAGKIVKHLEEATRKSLRGGLASPVDLY